jgi:hypothetical protein
MKKNLTRAMVFLFAFAALGTMSLTPRVSYGLNANDTSGGGAGSSASQDFKDRAAYQQAYEDAYEKAEIERAAELLADDGEEASSCG